MEYCLHQEACQNFVSLTVDLQHLPCAGIMACFLGTGKSNCPPCLYTFSLPWGFSSLYLVCTSKCLALDFSADSASQHLATLKFFVGSKNCPQPCLSMNQEQRHLQLSLQHSGSHNLPPHSPHPWRVFPLGNKNRDGERSPGDLMASSINVSHTARLIAVPTMNE